MNKALRFADGTGVVGAVFAALCCAGAPFIVSGLAAVGLSFIRKDAILLPLMTASLAIALWGFWKGRSVHRATGPFALAVAGSVALFSGVVYVHGPPAKILIALGSIALFVATVWNVRVRSACDVHPIRL